MCEQIRTVNVGVIGLGTVGGGTVRLLNKQREEYKRAYGMDARVARGCSLDEAAAAELGLTGDAFTSDWHDITSDPSIDIVVELIGGEHPATEIMLDAFAHGKHVVSANKALLGKEMERLAGEARAAGVQLRCEASCGGGIPIIDALERGLAGNDMLALAGIVNGTTNYILSRMDAEGLGFDEVLADAQRLGYAEADPTADVDGLDAAAKIAILSSIAFHTRVMSADVDCQGIRAVSAGDISWAREHDMAVKLLAVGRKTNGRVEARVQPAMIPAGHMLASVNGAMNAVFAVGDAVGETMFYGAGAGSFPTASAVVSDVLAIARPLSQGRVVEEEAEPYAKTLPVATTEDMTGRYYVRVPLHGDADADVQSAVRAAFEEHGVGIESIQQGSAGDLVILTEQTSPSKLRLLCDVLRGREMAASAVSIIRIEDTAAWSEGAEKN
ncbi:MAG: homoserine dehydrogenase [Coriobacteriaceae bacterium]|nr:homoserine dehydrogenase [Coriobacteriaceae bacterium]